MKQLNKTFIILQFGKPHEWTQKFIDHVQHLEQSGWYFKIMTPNKFKSKGNVEIVNLTIEDFNQLCEAKLGLNPHLYITDKGIPSAHVTDYMVMFGVIFEDYLKYTDFWGLIGIDCVVGRLDHFIKDFDFDIYSDDINTYNGNFSLMRNVPFINNLFKRIQNWTEVFMHSECPGCLGTGVHHLFGTDEYGMTQILRNDPTIVFKYPKYFIHGHDRLEIHRPEPKLKIEEDGSLWELISDINQPEWQHGHQNFGHEIAYYHFNERKTWPIL